MHLHNVIKKIISFQDLANEEMTFALNDIMSGTATPAQIAGFLIGLEMKSLSVEELKAAVQLMRSKANMLLLPNLQLVDIVGTGGDGVNTFNISTTSAFILAAAGAKVAKHGNRSVSSKSGSADVLEFAGVNLNLNLNQTKTCIEKLGVGFLFAPHYHPALKHAALPRKELGVRSFFNLLGPLSNPANANYLVIGVYDVKWLPLVAEVLVQLGCTHALIVHSIDGLDEISLSKPTAYAEVKDQRINYGQLDPEQFGIPTQPLHALQVNSVAESFQLMQDALQNKNCPARDIVLLNAGAAIYVANLANNIKEGIQRAREILQRGEALEKLEQLITLTQGFSNG